MVSEFSSTYDALAPRWDAWAGATVPDVREEWARKIEAYIASGERVVELGCGTGVPVGRFLAARYDYSGIDASPGMLAEARAALPGAQLTHADMHTVQFPPASLGAGSFRPCPSALSTVRMPEISAASAGGSSDAR